MQDVSFLSILRLACRISYLVNIMNSKAIIKPKSSKAKNRLANVMDKDPNCVVEQLAHDRAFVVSTNRKYCAWIFLHNDINWDLIFLNQHS